MFFNSSLSLFFERFNIFPSNPLNGPEGIVKSFPFFRSISGISKQPFNYLLNNSISSGLTSAGFPSQNKYLTTPGIEKTLTLSLSEILTNT